MSGLDRILITSGVVSSLLYALVNILVPLGWPEYSFRDHTVSELSAIGAPTRTLWLSVVWPYTVLFAAFGWGVLRSAKGSRNLFVAGWLIVVYSVFNAYWPPMHSREVLASGGGTLSDTLHLVWAGVTVCLFVLIMGFAAAALSWRFRLYTIVSTIVLLAFGLLTSFGAANVAANLPTPWLGIWERINIGVFLLWVITLSVVLLRRPMTRHDEALPTSPATDSGTSARRA